MIQHYAVVRADTENLDALRKIRPLTDEDLKDAWECYIECSDPENCPAWGECSEPHPGFDPDDEDSPYEGDLEGVVIHGERHDWDWFNHNWMVRMDGCAVVDSPDIDTPDGVQLDGPHRYLLNIEWDEYGPHVSVIQEVR